MAGKSPITASDEQRAALVALAGSRDRCEADRARAVLLTLAGWTSPQIAEAFGVREDTVRLWRSDFTAGRVAYQYLDGATPAAEREKRVAAFQAGAGELFLISLKAGGFGLNLTAADYVIHLDPWWNPAVETQASDRAHRIGQQRPVTIYRLIVKDSIEERIVALHRQKRDLADALLEGTDASARLSEEDLIDLIRSGEFG